MGLIDSMFSGIISLEIEDFGTVNANCQIDFNEYKITCYSNQIDFPNIYKLFAKEARIISSRIDSPYGELSIETDAYFDISSAHPGTMFASNSILLSGLVNRNSFGTFSLHPRDKLVLIAPDLADEIIVDGGVPFHGSLKIAGIGELVSEKDYTSISSPDTFEMRKLLFAIGVSSGQPSRMIATLKENRLKMHSRLALKEARQHCLFFTGYPIASEDLMREGFNTCIVAAINYFEALNKNSQLKTFEVFQTYSQARSATNLVELQLLGAFNFLEWLDGEKTLTTRKLLTLLGIGEDEAKALKKFRDSLTHNNQGAGEPFRVFVNSLKQCSNLNSDWLKGFSEYMIALNYVFSVIDKKILGLLNVDLPPAQYFPSFQKIWKEI